MQHRFSVSSRPFTRRRFLRGSGLAAGAVAVSPALAACRSDKAKSATKPPSSADKPVRGGTLTLRSFSDVSNFDYAFSSDVYSAFIMFNCVEPLLTVDAQAQPRGLLATSWENPDDRTYVFKLRQGVKFQDGTDLNADAVEYSLNRIHADKSSNRYTDLANVDKIEKPDPATVKLTLSSPSAPLLYALGRSAGCVVSPAIAEKYGKDRLKSDLTGQGTGPFKFVEWKSGDHVILARNDAYWGKDGTGVSLPYLDRMVTRVIPDDTVALGSLRAGEVDAFRPTEGPPPKDTAAVKADPSLALSSIPGLTYSYMVFNEAREPFGDKRLRQAVSCAIDRQTIAKAVFFDTVVPFDVPFIPSSWVSDPDYHPYLKRDVTKAKQLLTQAGKPNGFAFTFLTSVGSPTGQQTAELIKDQLAEAGIQMEIQQVEFATLNDSLKNGTHQVGNLSWIVTTYEPDGLVYPHFSSRGAQNGASRYNNAEVDRLLDQGRTTLDPAKRKPLYQQAQRLIMDDAVFSVLYARNAINVSSSKVKSLPLGPTPAVGLSQVWKIG